MKGEQRRNKVGDEKGKSSEGKKVKLKERKTKGDERK